MLTAYETARLLAEPFLPILHATARSDIRALLGEGRAAQVLDVGGRNSPYTIGLPAEVTIMDLPRDSAIQMGLHLGLTVDMRHKLLRRRSNVRDVVIDDMTRCSLPSGCFDGVVSVEVVEHVPDDNAFVQQIARVLRPGGWVYLTTPNGDYVKNVAPNYNPDHLRHYTRDELTALLERYFGDVQVRYGVKIGKARYWGLGLPAVPKPSKLFALSPRRPLRTLRSMLANVYNRYESRDVAETSHRTAHLLAIARKR